MVSTTSNSKENRVTVSNNAARYYSELSNSYAQQAKTYADLAKDTKTEISDLIEDEGVDVVLQNINNIKTVADNINNLGANRVGWGSITGDLSDQVDLKAVLDAKADELSLSSVATSGKYADLLNKPDIPTKVSDLTNDAGYLTSVPTEYVTETELNSKGFLIAHQDISGKQDALSAEQLAAIANVGNKVDISQVYTKTEIDTKIGDIETLLEGV